MLNPIDDSDGYPAKARRVPAKACWGESRQEWGKPVSGITGALASTFWRAHR